MATAALAAAARVEAESSKEDDAGPSLHASNGQPTSAFASPPHEDDGGQQSVASDGHGDDAVPSSPALEHKGDAVGIWILGQPSASVTKYKSVPGSFRRGQLATNWHAERTAPTSRGLRLAPQFRILARRRETTFAQDYVVGLAGVTLTRHSNGLL
jgi:hypothetical protein